MFVVGVLAGSSLHAGGVAAVEVVVLHEPCDGEGAFLVFEEVGLEDVLVEGLGLVGWYRESFPEGDVIVGVGLMDFLDYP